MSDHDHAHDLLAMSFGDIRALRGMVKSVAEIPRTTFLLTRSSDFTPNKLPKRY